METRLATIPVLSTQHSITLEKSIRLFHKVRVLVFFFFCYVGFGSVFRS